MGYSYLEHPTDVIVSVEAPTIEAALEYAAESVADITLDRSSVSESESRSVGARGDDLRLVLLDWLESANYLIITEGFAARRFEARLDGDGPYTVRGRAYGEGLDADRHGLKIEVKAPTLHGMDVSCGAESVKMRFLLDL